jgi:hypothetical protein
MKFDILVFFEILSKNIQVSLKSENIVGYFYERHYIFIISRSVLPRMRNVSDKSCRENQNTHDVFSDFFSKMMSFMRKCRKIF